MEVTGGSGFWLQMEDDETGTGPLESDVALLRTFPKGLTAREWACVVYRAGQKRLLRDHVALARRAVQAALHHLQYPSSPQSFLQPS